MAPKILGRRGLWLRLARLESAMGNLLRELGRYEDSLEVHARAFAAARLIADAQSASWWLPRSRSTGPRSINAWSDTSSPTGCWQVRPTLFDATVDPVQWRLRRATWLAGSPRAATSAVRWRWHPK